jgi:hypothetical protein
MFTTGSKLFLGGTALAGVAAVVWGVTTGGQVGWTAVIGLVSLLVVASFLAGINFFIKDGSVRAIEPGAHTDAPAARPPAGASIWPAVTALGVGTTVVGAETYPAVFQVGIVLMLAGGVEWVLQAWSERVSANVSYNASIRNRVAHPLEFPVFAAVLIGILIYSFSRIMLGLDKNGGRATFFAVAAVVLVIGFIAAASPGLRKGVVGGVAAIGLLGLVGVGVGFALRGEKDISTYPTTINHPEICEAPGEVEDPELREIDEKASQKVSNSANVFADVRLGEDETLSGIPTGYNEPQNPFTIARSNAVNIVFTNDSPEPRRFTVYSGTFPTGETLEDGTPITEDVIACTTLVEEGGEALLTLKFPKSNVDNLDPEGYRIVVPGVEAEPIAISVP